MGGERSGKMMNWIAAAALMGLWGAGSLLGQAGGTRSRVVAHLSGAAVPAQRAGATLAPSYSLLYSFQCEPDGSNPSAGLASDSAGNLYGTTLDGGQLGDGTVFKVTPTGTETVLHSFAGPPDGAVPIDAPLVVDPKGNIYGVTLEGGEFRDGVVFRVTTAGKETVLHSFTGGLDGGFPEGGLLRDGITGKLYGTASFGGEFEQGLVFSLSPAEKETVVYNFGSIANDGADPVGGLTLDSAGNLYGTAYEGGATQNGTVFKVTPTGTETVLHNFAGSPSDGALPFGVDRLQDTSGNLFGVTLYGGSTGDGVVFKVTSAGTESVLLNFNGGNRGGTPVGSLAGDPAGNLYGTTEFGGTGLCGDQGCGVLFKLGATGKESVLHNFAGGSNDGSIPFGGAIRVGNSLYGTLSEGGASGCGTVFKYTL